MIKILKTVTASPEQWEIIIEGMRNPHNSWANSDSYGLKYFDHSVFTSYVPHLFLYFPEDS